MGDLNEFLGVPFFLSVDLLSPQRRICGGETFSFFDNETTIIQYLVHFVSTTYCSIACTEVSKLPLWRH